MEYKKRNQGDDIKQRNHDTKEDDSNGNKEKLRPL